MERADVERYERLAALNARVARASAELQAARESPADLPDPQASELEELADRLQALHVLLANEVERAWNAAEAAARRARRAEMMGRVHDAVSAETTLPGFAPGEIWAELDLPGGRQPGGAEPESDR